MSKKKASEMVARMTSTVTRPTPQETTSDPEPPDPTPEPEVPPPAPTAQSERPASRHRRSPAAVESAALRKRPDPEAATPTTSAWPRAPRRPPTRRYTIDLEHRHHDALRTRAVELDTSASAIVRALLDLVEEDPALGKRLADTVNAE